MKRKLADFRMGELLENEVTEERLLVVAVGAWSVLYGHGNVQVYDPTDGQFSVLPPRFFDGGWDVVHED